jgi:phage terminase Nu1 subunit (DNA packaging protein)
MGDQVTARALANMLGVSKKVISELAKGGIIAPAGRGRYALEASVNSYCAYLRAMKREQLLRVPTRDDRRSRGR